MMPNTMNLPPQYANGLNQDHLQPPTGHSIGDLRERLARVEMELHHQARATHDHFMAVETRATDNAQSIQAHRTRIGELVAARETLTERIHSLETTAKEFIEVKGKFEFEAKRRAMLFEILKYLSGLILLGVVLLEKIFPGGSKLLGF